MRLRVLSSARADIDSQSFYLDMQRKGLGRRFLAAARRTVARIARRPGDNARYGCEHPRLADIRVCSVEGFPNVLVFYREAADATEILRVLHGARNIPALEDEILPGERRRSGPSAGSQAKGHRSA